MIWAALFSPLVILMVDWAFWAKIDGWLSSPPFAPEPWRLRRRQWGPLAACWTWIVVVAWRNGHTPLPVEDAAGMALMAMGFAIVPWWMMAVYRDIRG